MSLLLLLDDGPLDLRSLFSAGEQGIWLDPSDFSTLFQDAAGTTPVTAVGQPVGKILDKSGRGNHATQATAASRPTLQQDSNGMYYLSFDGTDDGMATPSINFTGTDKMTVWAGVRKLSDAAAGVVVELGSGGAAAGLFSISAPRTAASNYGFFTRSTTGVSNLSANGYAAPDTAVLSCQFNTSGAGATTQIFPRRNGVIPALATASDAAGGGAYGNYPLYIGRRGGTSIPLNGRIYQLIIRGAESNAGQIAATEAWCNSKTRAY